MKLNIYLTLSFRVNVVANAKKWTRNEKMNPKKVRNSKCQISERPSSQKSLKGAKNDQNGSIQPKLSMLSLGFCHMAQLDIKASNSDYLGLYRDVIRYDVTFPDIIINVV